MDAVLKQQKVIGRWKTVAESEFQSLGVIGINDLGKGLVRFLFNLTAGGCWKFENIMFLTKRTLGEMIDFSSSEQTPC